MGIKRRGAEAQRAKTFGHQEMEKPILPLGERFLNGDRFPSLRPLRLCASAFQFPFAFLGLVGAVEFELGWPVRRWS